MCRYGVSVGRTDIIVHACPMSGRKFVMTQTKGRITLEKQWHHISQPYVLQAIVKDILVEDKQFQQYCRYCTVQYSIIQYSTVLYCTVQYNKYSTVQYCSVEELFPPTTAVFMLGQPHYGAQGIVRKIDPEHKGRIQLRFEVPEEPDLGPVVAAQVGQCNLTLQGQINSIYLSNSESSKSG